MDNPLTVFTRGFDRWWVWVIFILVLAIWLWRVDRDMKNNGGEGLFGSDMFEGIFD